MRYRGGRFPAPRLATATSKSTLRGSALELSPVRW